MLVSLIRRGHERHRRWRSRLLFVALAVATLVVAALAEQAQIGEVSAADKAEARIVTLRDRPKTALEIRVITLFNEGSEAMARDDKMTAKELWLKGLRIAEDNIDDIDPWLLQIANDAIGNVYETSQLWTRK
jgi:hypothetical protein